MRDRDKIRAGTIFITGISASGKSTLGLRLKEDLASSGIRGARLIDGEDTRKRLLEQGKSYGYSPEERRQVALEMARMASEYNRQGIVCIICSICHTRALREEMRTMIGNVMEVYLDCPVRICAERDYKGQYAKAFEGLIDNFIGVTEHYQISEDVRLVLRTGEDSVGKCSKILLKSTMAFLKEGCEKPAEDAGVAGRGR